MISIIVCSGKESSYKTHCYHVSTTIGCKHEYIRIDNSDNKYGICAAYNIGVDKASGDILVFAHEDVFFITRDWGKLLEEKFKRNNSIGLIGIAGTQYLFQDNPFWVAAGRPFIKGRVVHENKNENRCILTVYSEEELDTEAVAADGLFFAVRKSLFNKIRFDEKTFGQFHFYDLDICMQVRKTHKIIITSDILVKHFSCGSFKETWKCFGEKFINKYHNKLPTTCIDKIPDPANRITFDSFPLEKILSAKTYDYIKSLGQNSVINKRSPNLSTYNRPITVVTGVHRSGTSCVAGLLSKCGFNIGLTKNLLNENKPYFDNQKGYFENINVVFINDTILKAAGGSWFNLPLPEVINSKGEIVKNHIINFSQTFKGNIIKDPRFCLTLNLWKKYCPSIRSVVICFRHPLSVAQSLKKRDNFPLETGLNLWYEYNVRLIDNIEHLPIAVVDYDNLADHLEDDLFDILQVTKSSITKDEMRQCINGFYERDLNHNSVPEKETEALPKNIKELYNILKSQSIAVRMGR